MINERMQMLIKYRDILLEILALESQILGPEAIQRAKKPEQKKEDSDQVGG